ncbi:hypothetical protein LP420_02755 [Massilia sp. B-10]|nr:hypothetical protein LP420_02755 [Massilia sp. B-10]
MRALEILLDDPQADAILFIHAPTAIVPSADIARRGAAGEGVVAQHPRLLAGRRRGGRGAPHLRRGLSIPTFGTPEEAVNAYLQIVQYRRNQNLLMQVPPS